MYTRLHRIPINLLKTLSIDNPHIQTIWKINDTVKHWIRKKVPGVGDIPVKTLDGNWWAMGRK